LKASQGEKEYLHPSPLSTCGEGEKGGEVKDRLIKKVPHYCGTKNLFSKTFYY